MPIDAAALFVGKLVVCGIFASAAALWILSAWFDRRLRTWEAVLLAGGLVVVMSIGVLASMRAFTGMLVLPLVLVIAALLLRGLAAYSESRLSRDMDEEDVEKYKTAVLQHPENPYAHSLLADAYRRMGELELAAQEYEAALQIDPSLKDERHWLQRMRAQLGKPGERPGTCDRCREPLPPEATTCPTCASDQQGDAS